MILHALNDFYERLAQDPDVAISPFGYSRQKIAFVLQLSPEGELLQVEDIREQKGKQWVPLELIVPGGAKPSGSGINPNFLWDNATYLLGYKPDDPKPERTAQSFEAFRDRHLALEEEIDDPGFSAVCTYLKNHTLGELPENSEFLAELQSGFGIFRIGLTKGFVHDAPKVDKYWQKTLQSLPAEEEKKSKSSDVTGQCLITGETAVLARLHEPKIKGVRGAQSSGAAIVSFNLDAFESYNKSQSYNSPVSKNVAFQYSTALNYLLGNSSSQRFQVGETTVVFWTAQPTPVECFFTQTVTINLQDEEVKLELQKTLRSLMQGKITTELGPLETPFYVLGLAPNAARISVRYWHVSTLGQMIEHLRQHFADLEIARSERDMEFPTPYMLLSQTAREAKEVPPLLEGGLLRAMLSGERYPDAIYQAVLRRIRLDRQVNYYRSAIIKAYLNRTIRKIGSSTLKKEITVSLDPDRPESAYHQGRLFAVLEKCQTDALTGLNSTIKDRFFGAASATPAAVFPRLIRLSQHHLSKLKIGHKINSEKLIQEICSKFDTFTNHLNMQEQGLFALGYYHQRQQLYPEKKTKAETEE